MEAPADVVSLRGWRAGPAAPVSGCRNENAIRRIARNLLENAIKLPPEGRQVDVRVARTDAEALLAVEDTGIGIREEHIPENFQTFRQESAGIRGVSGK